MKDHVSKDECCLNKWRTTEHPIRDIARTLINKLPVWLQIQVRQLLRGGYIRWEMRSQIQRFVSSHLPEASQNSNQILFWTAPGDMEAIIEVEAIIATALRLRGADVRFIVCDGVPVACVMREHANNVPLSQWPRSCSNCFQRSIGVLETYRLPYSTIGEFVARSDRRRLYTTTHNILPDVLPSFSYQDIDIGRLALASVTRYSMGRSITDYNSVFRAYLYAGLVNRHAADGIYRKFQPDRVVMSHGTYVDWGAAFKTAVRAEIPAVVWNSAFKDNHFFLRQETQDWHLNRLERISLRFWQNNKEKLLSPQEEGRLTAYINDRYGVNMAIPPDCHSQTDKRSITQLQKTLTNFDPSQLAPPRSSIHTLRQELEIPDNIPIWSVFTHLIWEGIFNFGPLLFRDEATWLIETINVITSIKDVTWLIRIHPGELKYPSAISALDVIREHFSEPPDHIRLIPPDSDINTFDLFTLVDGGVTIMGTVGLELALFGKPTILAGRPYYGNKGFTYDCTTQSEYFDLLRNVQQLPPLSTQQIEWAKRYAYMFYIRSQIPLGCLKKLTNDTWWNLDMSKNKMLVPGNDPVMDMICERIMNSGDFILNEDMIN